MNDFGDQKSQIPMTKPDRFSYIRDLLSQPLTRGLDINAAETTDKRRQIVRENIFLRRLYEEWYRSLANALPAIPGPVLELGSGPSFLNQFIPDLITSDILPCSDIQAILDGQHLPFRDASLTGIAMTNVLHHIPQPRSFFIEAARCVKPGGAIVMVEPWISRWSLWVYQHLHHEPCDPTAQNWEFTTDGPLSGANEALPWILFKRDRAQFEREFPEWRIQSIEPCMFIRYMLSGGVTMRPLVPAVSFDFWRGLENTLRPWRQHLAMFAVIVLQRNE